MDKNFFKKKFSIGLALDSEPEEYENLFLEYGDYIDNLYFSPPLGDRFHGRTKVAEQFHDKTMTERFWEILKVAQDHNIYLEVVFNTHLLKAGDLESTKKEFDCRNLRLNKVCVQDKYYEQAKIIFPKAKIVHSVNCLPDDRHRIIQTSGKYDEYVVGRQFIRDSDLFCKIQKQGSACVLLLNNGCSHWCGGCGKSQHCRNTYVKTRKRYTPQEIYAIQSIMPYEIWENMIDTSNVTLFKLSTRNADVSYIRMCLESYINNSALKYIKESTDYYLVWSRLLWLVEEFPHFDYMGIRNFKEDYNSIVNTKEKR